MNLYVVFTFFCLTCHATQSCFTENVDNVVSTVSSFASLPSILSPYNDSINHGANVSHAEFSKRNSNFRSMSDTDVLVSNQNARALYSASKQKNLPNSLKSHAMDEKTESIFSRELVWHKIGAFFTITIIGVFGSAMPYILKRQGNANKAMPYVNSFACGAFLGLALFHLLPEAEEANSSPDVKLYIKGSSMNATYLLGFIGFLLVFFVEKIIAPFLQSSNRHSSLLSHSHNRHHHHHHPRHSSNSMGHEHDDNSHTCDIENKSEKNSISSNKTLITASSSPGVQSENVSIQSLILSITISFHAVFEGVIIGLNHTNVTVWVSTLTVAGHKWAVAFSLAAIFVQKRVVFKAAFIYLAIFILATPLGVILGICASHASNTFIGIVNGISFGSILYAGCEMLFDEFQHVHTICQQLIKFLCWVFGAGVVFLLSFIHLGDNTHGHAHVH